MTRLSAKVKPMGGGNATMKATGWMCPEHRHLELDEETPFEKAWKIMQANQEPEPAKWVGVLKRGDE